MGRLCISTRGIGSWRERLANPDRQWKRGFSAFESAVSWELADSNNTSGLPEPIADLFRDSHYGHPILMLAVAEHKVDLPGGSAASQSDVWAVVKTSVGMVSLTVEAKANETFGDDILENWLVAGGTQASIDNRKLRFDYIRSHLPSSDSFLPVRYQLLHRCAASVIEAKRFGFQHAAFVVQAFNTPSDGFEEYSVFCRALSIPAKRGFLVTASVGDISLGIGWADCRFATDEEVAATA
jgi:hypothetical protein